MWDNGNGTYDPVLGPYSWISSGTDMLIYSVRRGSRIIGAIDSFCGVPIEEGDLLIPPPSPGMTPMIFIAAEALGLATARSNGVLFGDDLDAADTSDTPLMDCNGNGQEDAIDIFLGLSLDNDANGVPDECQPYFSYCFCNIPGDAPCGNNAAIGEGCRNSLGFGAKLTATGSNSIAQQVPNRLVLHATQARPNKNCVWLQGGSTAKTPFKDGLLCMGNPTIRLPGFGCHPFPVQTLDGAGALSTNHANFGFDIVAMALCKGDNIAANVPTTRYYQLWYRDGMGPCNTGSNLTNAVQVNWVP